MASTLVAATGAVVQPIPARGTGGSIASPDATWRDNARARYEAAARATLMDTRTKGSVGYLGYLDEYRALFEARFGRAAAVRDVDAGAVARGAITRTVWCRGARRDLTVSIFGDGVRCRTVLFSTRIVSTLTVPQQGPVPEVSSSRPNGPPVTREPRTRRASLIASPVCGSEDDRVCTGRLDLMEALPR